ncbi:MAG: DUF1217 domain-containing protein [Alphaproteobacteria bacterium]|nr:DUF1217 domain-containing protein [Alphaproteobacteria bacterium]
MTTISPSLALNLFASANGSGLIGLDVASLLQSTTGQSVSGFNAANIESALLRGEADKDKQLAQAAKDPVTQRELARFNRVLDEAESLDDVLDDPVARRVFLTANGLGDQAGFVGLAKKALASNAFDPDSLANKLATINGAWINTVAKYNFNIFGVTGLQLDSARKAIADGYLNEKRLVQLDTELPGLGLALQFKDIAKTLTTEIKVLGSGVGREVITKAFGIPAQIALQSLPAQERAIADKLDIANLQDEKFVDRVIYRYLLEVNGAGLSAGLTA